jgi:hypothetical protein
MVFLKAVAVEKNSEMRAHTGKCDVDNSRGAVTITAEPRNTQRGGRRDQVRNENICR